MSNDLVTFKLTKEAFSIIFNEGIPFEALKQILIKKFDESAHFFDGVKYKTILKGRNFSGEEIEELKEIIKDKIGFEEIEEEKIKYNWQANDIEGNTRFYRGTMRSGASIHYNGNVVVMGDINPGAEVVATGNIVVTGAIKGMVHAGCNGCDTAIISGLGINPTQIRIANIIAVPDKKKTNPVYETAYIKDNAIYIE